MNKEEREERLFQAQVKEQKRQNHPEAKTMTDQEKFDKLDKAGNRTWEEIDTAQNSLADLIDCATYPDTWKAIDKRLDQIQEDILTAHYQERHNANERGLTI